MRLATWMLLVMTALTGAVAADMSQLAAARSLVLNLAGSQWVEALEVAAPPEGIEAAWGLRVEWKHREGRPPWGNVGLGVRAGQVTGYSFDLYVESTEGPARLAAYLTEADGDRWVEAFDLEALSGQRWQHIDLQGDALRLWQFGDGNRQPETIGGLTLEPSGEASSAVFWLANVSLYTDAGQRDIAALMADADCPPATGVTPAERLPVAPRCYMGIGMESLLKEQGSVYVAKVREMVPNLGVAAVASSPRPAWAAAITQLRRDGLDVRVQNGGISGMSGLITKAQAWGVNSKGESRNLTPGFSNGMHGVSYCHPATREAIRRIMGAMRGVGVLDFEQIDYVWPWWDGPWGYGAWDLAAFRADLQELDEGLRLADGRTARFFDYIAAYGQPRITPEQCGFEAWDAFHPLAPEGGPPEAGVRRRFIFGALTHYEWLKFAQAMGTEARSWGGQFMASMNPEDVSNGGDYAFWNRLADTGEAYYECFGNPAQSEEWRHRMPYLREEATRSGKRMAVIYEVGVGGHGTPYLDPEVAYCFSYDIAASGQFDDLQNEWMDEGDWEASQTGYHRDRLNAWLATASGFNQAKADEAARPRPKVLAIGLRCVLHAIGFEPSYLLTRGALQDLNLDWDFADLTMEPERWERYNVIVYTPWESSREHLEALGKWLRGKEGRTLITHGAVPTRLADGLGYSPSAEIGNAELGRIIGVGAISKSETPQATVTESALAGIDVGEELAPPGGFFTTAAGEAIVRAGDQAVVTHVPTSNGSEVYYLNYAAGQAETRALDARVLRALLGRCGYLPDASAADEVYCHTYEAGPGHVAILWSRDACERFQFQYSSEIQQRMKYNDLDVDVTVKLRVPEGDYQVYDFLEDMEDVRAATDRGLPVKLSGNSCAMVYYGPQTQEWDTFVSGLRATRYSDAWVMPLGVGFPHRDRESVE